MILVYDPTWGWKVQGDFGTLAVEEFCKKQRKYRKLTRHAMALKTGVAIATYTRFERSEAKSLDTALRTLQALGYEITVGKPRII